MTLLGPTATIEVRMLGGLEVVIGGSSVVVTRAKVGALLAMLALQPNTVLSADRLIDGLWGEAVPGGATATLHSYISILRSLLESNATGGLRRVIHRKPGYLLTIEPECVDALRFESLVTRGVGSAGMHDHRGASSLLREALGLWRGAALVDLAFAAFAGPEITRLDQLRNGATRARP